MRWNARASSPPRGPALMRFAASRSLVCARFVGSSGYPPPPCPRQFTAGRAVPASRRPPAVAVRVHPSSRFAPLQSLPSSPSRNLSAQDRLPWGSRSLFATSAHVGCAMSSQPHRASALGVSHALGVFDRRRLGGFVSPHCRVQGFALQGFFLSRSGTDSSSAPALSSLTGLAYRTACAMRRQLTRPRPQGFVPCESSFPRRRCYPPLRLASLVGFSSSRCSLSSPPRSPSRPRPLVVFGLAT